MSNIAQEMASPKAIRDWCRATCAHYPNVDVRNMSTSFRDGLAFCAIIHRHRPDLIDFSSLSKDNVYQNNKLAFEIAETKLGIPALLDPNDMVSTKVPDCLSVITYLSQYYHFFNRKPCAGLPSLRSSHGTVLNNLTKSKTPYLKPSKSLTDFETSREDRLSNARPRTVCHLCFKPVHLIQRHLIDGKVYHRSCFRCKVCHSCLLPGSYSKGSDACSLICTYHITDSESTRGSAESRPKCTFQASYFSLDGLAITSVPRYTKKTQSQDRLVWKGRLERSREVDDRENRDHAVGIKSMVKTPAPPPHLPPPGVQDGAIEGAGKAGPAPDLEDGKIQQEATKTQEPSELPSPSVQATEESSRPVPAPRRMLDSSVVPVPAPRAKAFHRSTSCISAGNSSNQNKCSPNPSQTTSPASVRPRVKANHPWLAIIHPGPWTQLPPAPAPVPIPRSRSVSNLSWYRPKVPPPNPFGESVDEDTQPEPADQTKTSVAAIHSENGGSVTDKSGDTDAADCSSDAENTAIKSTPDGNVKPQHKPNPPKKPDFKEAGGAAVSVPAERTVGALSELDTGQTGVSDLDETENTESSMPDLTEAAAGLQATSDEAQSHTLSRSVSVPAIAFAKCELTEANESDQVTSTQSKLACKENPFDRNPAMPKSITLQELPSTRAPAPGHGFPLIKRKVQTDQNVSTENLQVELRDLDKHLEAMEERGVELETNLRDCKNDKEEEQMLMEWFSLTHERSVLVRRNTELVYLQKQQKLEERQADVEYELRCLLNRPESEWSQEDRGRERQLMDELVAIIDQRNQIVSSLDQDRQREREEDMLLESMMKNKDLQREGLKELKKSKGKFKPAKVFKMLNHKVEKSKHSVDKKS